MTKATKSTLCALCLPKFEPPPGPGSNHSPDRMPTLAGPNSPVGPSAIMCTAIRVPFPALSVLPVWPSLGAQAYGHQGQLANSASRVWYHPPAGSSVRAAWDHCQPPGPSTYAKAPPAGRVRLQPPALGAAPCTAATTANQGPSAERRQPQVPDSDRPGRSRTRRCVTCGAARPAASAATPVRHQPP